jgi:multidrug/hemolysin transport system permease protein
VIAYFLATEGQISAVGSIISSVYGFISGAYMPISSYAPSLRSILGFLPGTYGTVLTRSHAMRGAISELEDVLAPDNINMIMESCDAKICHLGVLIPEWAMYLYITLITSALVVTYVLLCKRKSVRK